MEVVKHDILTLPERGRRITDAFAFIPNRAVNLAVPKTGTAKILYMRGFRLFAMYVRTEPVHTYIAKSPKRAIYTILYDTELLWAILELLTKYTKAISYGIIEKKARKGGQNAAQNPHGDHRRSHAARPLFEEVGESA